MYAMYSVESYTMISLYLKQPSVNFIIIFLPFSNASSTNQCRVIIANHLPDARSYFVLYIVLSNIQIYMSQSDV